MPKLNDKEYKCDWCGGIFDFIDNEEWNENKAKEEYKQNFPFNSLDNICIICDDCYSLMRSNAKPS